MIQWNLDNLTLNWSRNYMSDYRGYHSAIYYNFRCLRMWSDYVGLWRFHVNHWMNTTPMWEHDSVLFLEIVEGWINYCFHMFTCHICYTIRLSIVHWFPSPNLHSLLHSLIQRLVALIIAKAILARIQFKVVLKGLEHLNANFSPSRLITEEASLSFTPSTETTNGVKDTWWFIAASWYFFSLSADSSTDLTLLETYDLVSVSMTCTYNASVCVCQIPLTPKSASKAGLLSTIISASLTIGYLSTFLNTIAAISLSTSLISLWHWVTNPLLFVSLLIYWW